MKKEIFYVTGNAGKVEEVQKFMQQHDAAIILKQSRLDIDEIQTLDQHKIAIAKAQDAWHILQQPLIIDDAGIYFEKYYKFPGTLSKDICKGIGIEGILKLVEPGDKAFFLLTMIYIDGPDSYQLFEGRCDGHITVPEKFQAHTDLPYDDIFMPEGASKSYAQMRNTDDMHHYFYRIRALKKFLDWYKKKSATE